MESELYLHFLHSQKSKKEIFSLFQAKNENFWPPFSAFFFAFEKDWGESYEILFDTFMHFQR